MVLEHESGYMCGFSVYTGKKFNWTRGVKRNTGSTQWTVTTKTVMGLFQSTNMLDQHRTIFFDNYFSSPELCEELLYRDSYACGMVCPHCKGLPKAVTSKKIKLKKGEVIYRRKENMLYLRWFDKRSVIMLSTKHRAFQSKVKDNYLGQPVVKPVVIQEYNLKMGSVDHSDHFLSYYQTTEVCEMVQKAASTFDKHGSSQFLHTEQKYGEKQMTHTSYREYIANYLISTSVEECSIVEEKYTFSNCWQFSTSTDWKTFYL